MPESPLTIACPLTHRSRCAHWAWSPPRSLEIDWNGNGGRILGPDAYLRFDLDEPRFISGLRFRFSLIDPGGMLPACESPIAERHQAASLCTTIAATSSTTGEEAEILIYVDDRISRVHALSEQSRLLVPDVEYRAFATRDRSQGPDDEGPRAAWSIADYPGDSGPGAFLAEPRPLARVGGRRKSAASHEDAPGDFTLVAHSPHCRIAPVSALVAILA